MRIIGVIDLLRGRAVHAQGGCRQSYRPVERIGATRIDGDPGALANAYVEHLGLGDLYVADLDAIAGGTSQDEARGRIALTGATLWVDAGVSTAARARRAFDGGAARVVIGLETLPSMEALRPIVDAIGTPPTVFSLDLRDGIPMTNGSAMRGLVIDAIVERAADAGAGGIIVLDLARVGSSRGPDFDLLARVRRLAPGVQLLAGGGARGAEDVRRLVDVGCDGVLVATALHGAGAAELVRAAASPGHAKVTR